MLIFENDAEANLTEARIVELEEAMNASPEFVAKITAAAAAPGTVMSAAEFNAWLAAL